MLVAVSGLEMALVSQELACASSLVLWDLLSPGRSGDWRELLRGRRQAARLELRSCGGQGAGAPRVSWCVWGDVLGLLCMSPRGVLRKVVPGGCLALGTVLGWWLDIAAGTQWLWGWV